MQHETVAGAWLEHWSPEEAQATHARDGITLIDVRTPQEFAFEHIEGALLAPLATFQPRNLPGHTEKPLAVSLRLGHPLAQGGRGLRGGRLAHGRPYRGRLRRVDGGAAALCGHRCRNRRAAAR
jgi:rhodanese-related sulfurtransferase